MVMYLNTMNLLDGVQVQINLLLVLFIIMLLTGYICLLIYDVMHPEIGFIRVGLQALFNMIFGVHILCGGVL